MYTLVSATVLGSDVQSQYETVDLSQTPINIIYSQYSEIYLTLSNPYLSTEIYVDFNQLKPQLAGYAGLISQWLANIGNATLPSVESIPSQTIAYARYSDATHAGYKAQVCKIGFQIPLNYPTDLLPDLQITRPNYTTNLSLAYNNCIATVNGYLHPMDFDGTNLFIQQGAVTMRKSNLNNFGLLSFLDIGTVQTLPIDITKIYADTSNNTLPFKNKIYLNINQDTTGKTVLLSLGGYLVYPQENIFYQVGNGIFCLQIDNLPILQRYFESNQYIDLSSLNLDFDKNYPQAINAPEFLSNQTLLNYLSLIQSFWIVVNTANLDFDRVFVQSTKMPGFFVSYDAPINPLFVGYGRMAEYWPVYEDNQWAMTVDKSFLLNYDFATNLPSTVNENVNSATVPGQRYYLSQGYTLRIHT